MYKTQWYTQVTKQRGHHSNARKQDIFTESIKTEEPKT